MKTPINVHIAKTKTKWANRSSASTIMRFVEAGFGHIEDEKGNKIDKITSTSWGKYKYYESTIR